NVSKNHVLCARCQRVGLVSGIACTTMSSMASGSTSVSVVVRMARYRSGKESAGMARSCGEAAVVCGISGRPRIPAQQHHRIPAVGIGEGSHRLETERREVGRQLGRMVFAADL